MPHRVFAVAAHPDDIELGMAGTLVLLARAGCEIHCLNIADGSCGTAEHGPKTIADIRFSESKNAAARIGAVLHPPLVPDIEIFYEKRLLGRIGSIMRKVSPDILLVPSPQDYMEDHVISCRLAVTAAFCRNMKNFCVEPEQVPISRDITVYHAQPHGNKDYLGRSVMPDFIVDIDSAIDEKICMLAEHKSQKEWLDKSQGMNVYLDSMKGFAREVAAMSSQCEFAEGWRRHNHLGLSAINADPLSDILAKYIPQFLR